MGIRVVDATITAQSRMPSDRYPSRAWPLLVGKKDGRIIPYERENPLDPRAILGSGDSFEREKKIKRVRQPAQDPKKALTVHPVAV